MPDHKQYWERIRKSVNLVNAKDRTKARAERHRFYVATGQKKFLKMKKVLTTKDIRRAYKVAKARVHRQAVKAKKETRQIRIKQFEANYEAALFAEDEFPTHIRSDIAGFED